MVIVFRLLIPLVVIFLLYRFLKGFFGEPRFRCASCRHCGSLDSDGVICRFGRRETFKNPVHIQNCMDYSQRGR